MFCTVIALGVLVMIAPLVLEALGFAELGPIPGEFDRTMSFHNVKLISTLGSFAATWQARYAGYVPKGSLFSFLQRLGMISH